MAVRPWVGRLDRVTAPMFSADAPRTFHRRVELRANRGAIRLVVPSLKRVALEQISRKMRQTSVLSQTFEKVPNRLSHFLAAPRQQRRNDRHRIRSSFEDRAAGLFRDSPDAH
jgi:hypothetical protein